MNNIALVGWKIRIQWLDGDIEDYYVEDDNETNIDLHHIKYTTKFVDELIKSEINKEHSYKVNDIEQKFTIIKISNKMLDNTISERGLTKIYHFTPIKNIQNILKYGLLSKGQLIDKKINFDENDDQRFDKHLDCISCSLEHPNFKLLYKNKINLGKKYCIIKIDVSILKEQFSVCSKTNAAKNSGRDIMPITFLEKLFEGPRPKSLPNYYPTDEQAEILIRGPIPTKYIKAIVFDDYSIYKQYANTINNNIVFEYNPILFKPRGDYE